LRGRAVFRSWCGDDDRNPAILRTPLGRRVIRDRVLLALSLRNNPSGGILASTSTLETASARPFDSV
jgi:hypothetical protein